MKTPSAADARAHLMTTIDEEILPKLMLVHMSAVGPALDSSTRVPPREDEITELARIAASRDLSGTFAYIESRLEDGLSCGTVLLTLVRPAARLLSEEWESDGRTFDDAMDGLDTLEQVVQVLVELMHRADPRG